MIIKQISIFVENKSGKMADITKIISDSGVDIRALSIADTTDYGILRLIVDDPERAEQALKAAGQTFSVTDVIAAAVPDEPGGLHSAVSCLSENGVSIEYMYAFLNPKQGTAFVIMRVDDNQHAIDTLTSHGIAMMTEDEVNSL